MVDGYQHQLTSFLPRNNPHVYAITSPTIFIRLTGNPVELFPSLLSVTCEKSLSRPLLAREKERGGEEKGAVNERVELGGGKEGSHKE